MLSTPLLGEAARTSWPPWRRMATVFEPIRPVPPMTTIFMVYPPLLTMVGRFADCSASAVSGHASRDAGRLVIALMGLAVISPRRPHADIPTPDRPHHAPGACSRSD